VALTYDDGPSETWTPRVLDMLAEQGVRVTFFLVGRRAAAHPQLVRRAAEAGHEFANHTWSHADLSRASEEEADRQLRRTDELVRRLTGTRPRLMRPPWGRIDAVGLLAACRLDYTVALWSQLILERQLSADQNVRNVVAGAGPGSMILVHDGGPVPNGSGLRAVAEIIDRLTRDGYRFVTVSELIAAEAAEAPGAERRMPHLL
jgi:peptidoglycan/xylan/chitin deacetylase (PgdA/CDA1 family)